MDIIARTQRTIRVRLLTARTDRQNKTMFRLRTLKFFAAFILVFCLLLLPAYVWPKYLDSFVGIVVLIPYLSIYLFHKIGILGLLQNNGACGWGWCAPTMFGWVFLCIFWLFVVWLMAWALASFTDRSNYAGPKDGAVE